MTCIICGYHQRRKDCSDGDHRYFHSAALTPGRDVQLDFGSLRGRVLGFRGAAPASQTIGWSDKSPALPGQQSLEYSV